MPMNPFVDRALPEKLSGWLVVAVAAAVPISVAATSVFMLLAILAGLVVGQYAGRWRDWFAHPVLITALALFGWLALSVTYSVVSAEASLGVLKKYRELLLIPLLMPLLLDEQVRRRAIFAFMAAMLLTLVLSYLDAARQLWQEGGLVEDPEVFKKRITQSVFLGFAAYWAWLQAEREPARRWLWWLLIGLIAFNVFAMLTGRSGQVVFLALAALILFRRFRWKGFLLTGLLGMLLLGGAYLGSELFRDRVAETLAGLSDFRNMDFTSSTALRISYYPNSLQLIAERPLLGHGVGSILEAYSQQVAGTAFPPTNNPHNEFLALGIQAGLPAVLSFAGLLVLQWRQGRRLPREQAMLLQGFLVTMAVGSLFNSFLMDSAEGHWYALFSALLLYNPVKNPDREA